MNAAIAISKVINAEGGAKYTNDPKDSGGPTKYGITLATLSEWRKKKCTAEDVKNLTEAEAIAIYKNRYWDRILGDKLPYNIAYSIFNQSVVRGVGAAVMTAQEVVGLQKDGGMGLVTLSKILSSNEKTFLEKFLALSIQEAKELAARRPKDTKYLKGWINRINHISDYVGVKPAIAAGGAGVVILAVVFFLIFNNSAKRKIA